MCLVGAIDDATGQVLYGRFSKAEDQNSYMVLLRTVATEHGIPESIYHDRHIILRSPKEATLEEQRQGTKPMSQVQRVMEELGIGTIPAGSPQAKGRLERLWKTLQDRLVQGLRLANVTTLEQANAFLPGFLTRHNARIAISPRTRAQPLCRWLVTPTSSACSPQRRAASFITTTPSPPTGKRVDVHLTPEGGTCVYCDKRPLAFRVLDPAIRKEARARASSAKPLAGDALRITNPAPAQKETEARLWTPTFQVFHHGPSPQRDLDFYNKLSAGGGQFP